jgi:hypothetical protein
MQIFQFWFSGVKRSSSVIVARRNEFLRELFRLLRSKEDISSTSFDDDDDELKTFLRRFDIGKEYVFTSIDNLKVIVIFVQSRAWFYIQSYRGRDIFSYLRLFVSSFKSAIEFRQQRPSSSFDTNNTQSSPS